MTDIFESLPRVNARDARAPLPKAKSQSGRRLFVLVRTEQGRELRLDIQGRFQRWLLGDVHTAIPAGDQAIDPAYREGRIPSDRVTLEDSGAYEIIEGSHARGRLELWFSGRVMTGRWLLEQTEPQLWSLTPSAKSSQP